MRRMRLAVVLTIIVGLAPLAVEGRQAGKVPRVGILQPGVSLSADVDAFRQGLREHGYIPGQNIVPEYRIAAEPAANRSLITELIGLNVDVIVTWTTPAVLAVKQVTKTIPIVGISGDPVQTGLIASLAHPGGNLTGLAIMSDELELKDLQLLKEALPTVARVGVLWNPDNPVWPPTLKRLEAAAPRLGVRLELLAARKPSELDAAFAAATARGAGALLVVNDAVFGKRVVDLGVKNRLPTIYENSNMVKDGGLMSYSAHFPDMLRRAATYVDKILKGAKPADLPVEQPTKFELVINLKTAKTLGLTIPQSVLIRADEIIQ